MLDMLIMTVLLCKILLTDVLSPLIRLKVLSDSIAMQWFMSPQKKQYTGLVISHWIYLFCELTAQHPTQSTLTFQGATMPGTSCIQELEAHDAPAHDYANIKENKNQARRDRDQARRCKQTPEEREAINARRRDRYRARQNKQTPEEKEANNACRRE